MIRLKKELAAAEIETLEQERRRVASDLHDEIGPQLSAIKFIFGSVKANEQDKLLIEKGNNYIDDVILRVRDICNNLMPSLLVRSGVVLAVKEFITNMPESNNIKIDFAYSPGLSVTDEMSVNLYRIIIEIIHNTLKHANASKLAISLVESKYQLILKTADDGVGFNFLQAISVRGGHGLSNLQKRVEMMDSEMLVESNNGKGIKYTIAIPLK